MKTLFILAIMSAVATLVVLFMGVMTMGRGTPENKLRGNKLMRWRIGFQGLTLLFLLLAAASAATS